MTISEFGHRAEDDIQAALETYLAGEAKDVRNVGHAILTILNEAVGGFNADVFVPFHECMKDVTEVSELPRAFEKIRGLQSEQIERIQREARRLQSLGTGEPREVKRTWLEEPPVRNWLISQWLATGRIALFTGEGGRGKSRLALQLAAAVAANEKEWLPQRGPNLEVVAEGVDGHAVIATWEDECDEIARRLEKLKNLREKISDRLHVLDFAGVGALWGTRS